MNKIPKEVFSYVTSLQDVHIFPKGAFLTTKNGTYLYLKYAPSSDIYSYLKEISFEAYYPLESSLQDSYQLFYLAETKKSRKILSFLLSLYEKSVQEVLWDSNQLERISYKISYQYNDLLKYYYSMQDAIEEMYYPRKSFYHLLLSISIIYHLIYLGTFFFDQWMQKSISSYREVLTVHNLEEWNYYDDGVLDFSSARKDYYIFELANYYQRYYKDKSILEQIDSFFEEFSSTEDEKFLFYSLITCIWKIDGEDLDEVENLIFYGRKTYDYLLEKYKKYEETK